MLKIRVGHFNYNNKNNVGYWELVWHTLIRQKNVTIVGAQVPSVTENNTNIS